MNSVDPEIKRQIEGKTISRFDVSGCRIVIELNDGTILHWELTSGPGAGPDWFQWLSMYVDNREIVRL